MNRLFLVCVLLVAACGGDETNTKGELCDDTGMAFCKRAVECSAEESFDACFQAFKGGCCIDDRSCEVKIKGADIAGCASAFSKQVCSENQAGVVPAVCLKSN